MRNREATWLPSPTNANTFYITCRCPHFLERIRFARIRLTVCDGLKKVVIQFPAAAELAREEEKRRRGEEIVSRRKGESKV